MDSESKIKAYVEGKDGVYRWEDILAPTSCGEMFCDACGDCYTCYSGDPCYDGNEDEVKAHFWVKYR